MQALDPEFAFPAGDTPSCGNRTDVPRAQRVHDFRDAGIDTRHQFDGMFVRCRVKICVTCGADREARIR